MKISRTISCLLMVSTAMILCFDSLAQDGWKLKTDKDEVQVYMKAEENSSYKSVKTVTTMRTTLSAVSAILLDVLKTPDWVYGTKQCSLLKKESPTSLYYYAEMGMPWPVSNRDFVIRISLSQNPQTKVVTVIATNLPTYIPEKDGIVRIQRSSGRWTISPVGNGMVRVEYILQIDPGGSLPASIVNMFSYNGPFQSFKNLRVQVNKPEYAKAQLPFITEP
jgi:hypothetical protein